MFSASLSSWIIKNNDDEKVKFKRQVILQVWPSYVAGPSEDIREDVVGYRIEIFKISLNYTVVRIF